MYKVSDEQIDYILIDLEKNGIDLEDLKYNLLDHICCILENEYTGSNDFYSFYENIKKRFFKDSLMEIQEETERLLTFKDYYAMKRTLKIAGLTSASLTIIGAILKTYHLPGAGISYVLGAVIFSLVFMPLMILLKFKDDESKAEKWVFTLGFILGIVASTGVLFRMMHWPYAYIMARSSITLFIFLYIPLYYIVRSKKPEQKFNTLVNSVLMMACGGLLYGLFQLHPKTSNEGAVKEQATVVVVEK